MAQFNTDPDIPGIPPTTTPDPTTPTGSYTINGTPPDALVNALYPGYKVVNGQLVGTPTGGSTLSNPALAADYINRLWGAFSSGDYRGFIEGLHQDGTPRADWLHDYAKILNSVGITIPKHANGTLDSQDKIVLPNGRMVDLITNVGGPNAAWAWNEGGGPDTPNPNPTQNPINPDYLKPFNTTFGEFAPTAYGTGTGNLNPPTFQGPGEFTPPTADSINADPSYQFRRDQSLGAIKNWAYSRGLGGSSGTGTALSDYAGQAASQEYGNIWNRDFSKWDTDWAHAVTGFGLNKGANDTAYQRAFGQYQDARKTFYDNQQNPYDKIFRYADLGSRAAAAG